MAQHCALGREAHYVTYTFTGLIGVDRAYIVATVDFMNLDICRVFKVRNDTHNVSAY
jgi:hypothetical protein